MEYIKIFILDLPHRIHGITYRQCIDGEDMYFILINARLSAEMQVQALDHEMEHINSRDFDSIYTADDIEYLRHTG